MSGAKKYHGVVVPMVTPLSASGKLDEAGVASIIENVLQGGCTPFVLGTTGEASSVPAAARRRYVELTVKQVAGRTLTYAGISGNCLRESVDAAKDYFDLGIDVAVAHLPSYYPIKPDQMLRYYELLATSIPGPLMLYNIPVTTHLSIPVDVVDQLSHHHNIVGFKDSERDDKRFEEGLSLWRDRADFAHFTGAAPYSSKALALGSDGLVPSTANFAPGLYRALYDAAVGGDEAKVSALQERTDRISQIYQKGRVLSQALAALKVIMKELGLCGEAVLPPLFPPSEDEQVRIKAQLEELGVSAGGE